MDLFSELLARASEDMPGTFLLLTIALIAALKLETSLNVASVCDPKERACVEASVQGRRSTESTVASERRPASIAAGKPAAQKADPRDPPKQKSAKKASSTEPRIRKFLYGTTIHE